MNSAIFVFALIGVVVVVAWAVFVLVVRIGGKRFDREWARATPEQRRQIQESAYQSNIYAQSTPVNGG